MRRRTTWGSFTAPLRVPGRLLGDVLLESSESEQQKLLTPFVHLLVDLHTMNLKALVAYLFHPRPRLSSQLGSPIERPREISTRDSVQL